MDIKKTLLLCLLLIPTLVFAHGGRTDKYGRHNDRKSGDYHNGGTPNRSHRVPVNSLNANSAKPQTLTAQTASSQVRDANLAAYKNLALKN